MLWMRSLVLGSGVGALLGLVFLTRVVLACSPSVTPTAQLDPAKLGVDVAPPVLESVSFTVERDVPNGCNTTTNIDLFAEASDDQTPFDELGYRVEPLRGDTPIWPIYDEPLAYMHLWWVGEDSRTIDVELRVRAVDEAGNESEPIDVHVVDRLEDSDAGCSVAARPSNAASSAALPLVLILVSMSFASRRRWAPMLTPMR